MQKAVLLIAGLFDCLLCKLLGRFIIDTGGKLS